MFSMTYKPPKSHHEVLAMASWTYSDVPGYYYHQINSPDCESWNLVQGPETLICRISSGRCYIDAPFQSVPTQWMMSQATLAAQVMCNSSRTPRFLAVSWTMLQGLYANVTSPSRSFSLESSEAGSPFSPFFLGNLSNSRLGLLFILG